MSRLATPTADISGPRISSLSIPIAKIAGGRSPVIFVVAGSRASAGFEPAPGRAVAFEEFFIGAALVGQVARGEDRAGNRVDEFGGGFGGREIRAADNVSRTNESKCIWRSLPGGFRMGFGGWQMPWGRFLG